jgi:sRNA-binding carbon storage regulator CsrA
MLVLSRNEGERVILTCECGCRCAVQVVGGRTRLGIIAPPEVRVDREEVFRRKVAADLPGEESSEAEAREQAPAVSQ